MLRVTMCLTMLWSSFGMTMGIRAAEVPVEAFPANSGVVIRIGDIDKTVSKVKELMAAVEPDEGKRAMVSAQLDFITPMSAMMIDNPAKLGVKDGTDWWFAAIAKGGPQPPAIIIAVQPADVATVKDAVGDEYTYVEFENWLLYTKDDAAAKAVQACVDKKAPSIEPAADETTKAIFMKSDAALFVHIKELAKTYQNELQMAQLQVNQALEEAQNFAPPVQGMNIKAVFDMYRDMITSLLTAVEESNSCSVGLTVSAKGIHVDEYLHVKAGTSTSKFLASHPKGTLKTLNMLPAKQPVYVGISADMTSLSKWGLKFVQSMFSDENDGTENLDAALEKMGELDYGSYVASMGLGDLESGLLRSAGITEVKNAKKARATYVEMFKLFNSINSPLMQQTMEYKEGAETVGGESVDTLTVKQEFDESIDPTGLQRQMMEKMYGPGGAVTRMVYLDDQVVQTMGGGPDALADLLKTIKSPASDSAVEATRSQLAPEANLVALVDLPSLAIRGVYIAAEAGFFDASLIPELAIDRSYMGYSVAMSADGIDVDAHIPAEQIRGLYLIGMTAFMMFNAPQ